MEKPSTDARSAKQLQPVKFKANGKARSTASGSFDNVATANGDSDHSTSGADKRTPAASGVSPNSPDFVASEEMVVVKHRRDAANFQLAIYIAMAHAGLVAAIAICYGFALLLKDYWTPIQWALLVSMPLQRVQEAVAKFWMRHLQAGSVEALLAIPAAMGRALLQTGRDLRTLVLQRSYANDNVSFGKLFDWLFSLAMCTFLFENLGPVYSMAVACFGFASFRAFKHVLSHLSETIPGWLHRTRERRGTGAIMLDFTVRASRWSNRGVAGTLMRNLQFLVSIQLITLMMVGFIGATILFSYKMGVETKDAIVAFKLYMDNSRSEAGKGISDWLQSNSSYYIDSHMMVAYDSVVQKVDKYAEENNMTAIANAAKEFLNAIAYNETIVAKKSPSATNGKNSFWNEFLVICQILQEKYERREFKQVIENLVQRSGSAMTGSFSVLVVLGSSVASFLNQVMVFAFVLFFFITSETGGVMEQCLQMVPLSEVTRQKCASVLDRTISVVFLTTGKLMLFQALFTYLFFRSLNVHFLYMSTSIAMAQGVMPIFPNWVPLLPALLQLLAQRRFACAMVTSLLYKGGMDYGIGKIQGIVSNYNRYLTGLSIAGGMALFQPAICGVVMGPLILTCILAIRDLYFEFVLEIVNDYQCI